MPTASAAARSGRGGRRRDAARSDHAVAGHPAWHGPARPRPYHGRLARAASEHAPSTGGGRWGASPVSCGPGSGAPARAFRGETPPGHPRRAVRGALPGARRGRAHPLGGVARSGIARRGGSPGGETPCREGARVESGPVRSGGWSVIAGVSRRNTPTPRPAVAVPDGMPRTATSAHVERPHGDPATGPWCFAAKHPQGIAASCGLPGHTTAGALRSARRASGSPPPCADGARMRPNLTVYAPAVDREATGGRPGEDETRRMQSAARQR
jgi:hypothetical protein